MRVSGFSIANNAVRFGYPIEASLRSMLPLVDEVILNIGDQDQETWDLVQSMHEPKIKPFRSHWDFSLRSGGVLLSQQTNLALERCSGDWALYLQADEVLHEKDYPVILRAMEDHRQSRAEVLRFRYYHFYGSFQTIQDYPQRWYSRAGRGVKLGIGASSWGDAMDFCVRRNGREWFPRQADINAHIYHYGWARPPQVMRSKWESFERLYHEDEAIKQRFENGIPENPYCDLGNLQYFRGTHPAAMCDVIARQNWQFDHGIERQPPDWYRHARVWANLYFRRLGPAALMAWERAKRAMMEWTRRA